MSSHTLLFRTMYYFVVRCYKLCVPQICFALWIIISTVVDLGNLDDFELFENVLFLTYNTKRPYLGQITHWRLNFCPLMGVVLTISHVHAIYFISNPQLSGLFKKRIVSLQVWEHLNSQQYSIYESHLFNVYVKHYEGLSTQNILPIH